MTRAPLPPHTSAGFTLLELLIAITLLGLLMAALFGGLRLGARAWERGEERLDESGRLQVVQNFLRERLGEAYPLSTDDQAGRPVLAFEGSSDALRFVTVMPEHLGTGFAEFLLAVADRGDAKDLVVQWRRFDSLQDVPNAGDGDEPQTKVLLEGIEALEIAYYGALQRGQPAIWREQWLEARVDMPRLVRLRVVFFEDDRRYWPDLIVRPMTDAVSAIF
ncbi:MAG TPA: prepilin-type N-terminal cleavage/methylation domain-containing protein [Geminicoccaceae bacterium]|jgi:general secretion pathway protein J|nr:prepilin-type N-terminal cleavage/methylation domain-containing protein [Geminicoccaceae bacterium]